MDQPPPDSAGGLPPPTPPGQPPGAPPPADSSTAPTAPPAAPGAWPPVAPEAPGPGRPGVVTVSAIILITLGILPALVGLVLVLAGALFDTLRQQPEMVEQLGQLPAGFGVLFLVLGLVLLSWGVLEVLAGIFILARRTWARITGIIVGILGVLIGLAAALPGEAGLTAVGVVLAAMFIGGHAFAIWALGSRGRWFSGA